MSSWVQLLALLMAACVRFGGAEGDPLPAALVELVRTSPISSIEDLELLLLSDSTDEDLEGSPDHGGHSNNTINRHPRSLDAQPAQQALCKIRTVVTEVTRAMLDRSNAHFLLWPPCVEVQRCSGCCNTKTLQCVPVLTHTRHLQVMKIQYINKQPTYAKAVVSVVDHVECRCQPAPRIPATPKKKPSPHTPPRERQGGRGQSKGRSKEELHHGDELKHNQRLQLEELLEQHWSPKESASSSSSSSSSSPGPGEGGRGHGPAADTPPSEGSPTQGPLGGGGRPEAGRHDDDPEERRRDGGANGTGLLAPRYAGTAQAGPPLWTGGGDTGQESLLGNRTEGNKGRGDEGQQETQRQAARTTDTPCQGSGSPRRGGDASSEEADQRRDPAGAANQRRENRFRPTAETNQGLGSDNDTPESEGRRRPELPEEQAMVEEERKELLRLHRRLDQEKEQLRLRQREEEEAEGRQQQRQRHKQQQQQQTTTQIADTASPTSTRPPPVPAGPRPPARPAPARKRMRKNRKRISKAAMRAMLM